MAPHRRASERHSHAKVLRAINARNSISTGNSASGSSDNAPSRAERWAGTVRNQLRHMERDGLRRTFWNRRAFGTNTNPGGDSYASRIWDRVRRMPELLLVEYEDPVEPASPWREAEGDELDSSDTTDLLDEDRQGAPSSSTKATQRSIRKRSIHKNQLKGFFGRTRRALGVSRTAFALLILLLMLGIYETTKISSISSRRLVYQNPMHLKINTKDPFQTLLQAGIDVQHPSVALAESNKMAVGNPKMPVVAEVPSSTDAKVTAIVLNWKRADNLVVIAAHLCAFTNTIFNSVHIWNNNPDTFLTHDLFASSRCPKGKLRIHNSPGNLLFMARFMACSLAQTPYVDPKVYIHGA